MMASPLVCRAVSRRYQPRGAPPVVAVDRVDLEVRDGEIVAIQGPSGSGKTTLLGLLAGLESADDGVVTVLGHDVSRLSPSERARLRRTRMGIVFQSFGLVASLTAGENVTLPLILAGVSPVERAERAQAMLAEVGLDGLAGARIDELSGGQRQRIGVARAICAEPSIVLADEPTGSLDDDTAAGVLELLLRTTRTLRASLVLVTHDPASAAMADRVLRMRDGKLEASA